MILTAGQAAKETGKSIPTIVRAVKNGTITGRKLENGGYEIEASELFRVFPRVTPVSDVTPVVLGSNTPNDTGALEVEIKLLRERLSDKDAVISDLREDRDRWRDMAERTTKLLPPAQDNKPAAPPPVVAERPSLFSRLFGRGKS